MVSIARPLPVTRAILFADSIITEEETQKKSLIGIYSHVIVPKLPRRKILNVYAQIADAKGEYVFTIELVRLNADTLVHRGQIGPLLAPDPLQPMEIVLKLPCFFEHYGEYEFRILHQGKIFASRVLSLLPLSELEEE